MGVNVSAVVSFIVFLMSLVFFVLPAAFGSSILEFSFIVSMGLLMVALGTAAHGLRYRGGLSGLALLSLILSTAFLIFLIMAVISQA